MADHQMRFSAPMIRAILREIEKPGTGKTQTRRTLKPQPESFTPQIIDIGAPHFDEEQGAWGQWETVWSPPSWHSPMGEPMREEWVPLRGVLYAVGDRLWAREAWRAPCAFDRVKPSEISGLACVSYEAGGDDITFSGKLRPSMFMPRWASRLTLYVADVRVERLQDISEADAIAEGVPADYLEHIHGPGGYRDIWDAINGPGAWEANPWVVVYTFTPRLGNIDSQPATLLEAA